MPERPDDMTMARYLEGSLTPEEQAQVEAWLQATPGEQALVEEWKSTMHSKQKTAQQQVGQVVRAAGITIPVYLFPGGCLVAEPDPDHPIPEVSQFLDNARERFTDCATAGFVFPIGATRLAARITNDSGTLALETDKAPPGLHLYVYDESLSTRTEVPAEAGVFCISGIGAGGLDLSFYDSNKHAFFRLEPIITLQEVQLPAFRRACRDSLLQGRLLAVARARRQLLKPDGPLFAQPLFSVVRALYLLPLFATVYAGMRNYRRESEDAEVTFPEERLEAVQEISPEDGDLILGHQIENLRHLQQTVSCHQKSASRVALDTLNRDPRLEEFEDVPPFLRVKAWLAIIAGDRRAALGYLEHATRVAQLEIERQGLASEVATALLPVLEGDMALFRSFTNDDLALLTSVPPDILRDACNLLD